MNDIELLIKRKKKRKEPITVIVHWFNNTTLVKMFWKLCTLDDAIKIIRYHNTFIGTPFQLEETIKTLEEVENAWHVVNRKVPLVLAKDCVIITLGRIKLEKAVGEGYDS